MRTLSLTIVGLGVMALSAGCGGPDDVNTSKTLQNVRKDIGGVVSYINDPDLGLAAVITITALDGIESSATANANGLWRIEDVVPGQYAIRYELAGYQTINGGVTVAAAPGENDVGNIYVDVGKIAMTEDLNVVTIGGAFTATVVDGDNLVDGIGGFDGAYSLAAAADITFTFALPIYGGGVSAGFGGVIATPNATHTTYTLDGAAMGALFVADTDPFTFESISVDVMGYTPIHGDETFTTLSILFNADP